MRRRATRPDKLARFHLLRYFSVSSFVVLVVMTIGFVLLYREYAVDRLLASEERQNVATTRLFSNVIYPRFAKHLSARNGRSADELRASPATARLDRAVRQAMHGLRVLKVKVYDRDGITIYSSQASQIGEDKRDIAGFIAARAGGVASGLSFRGKFSAFEGEVVDRNVIASYVPIRSKTGAIVGVFEVYSDVTPYLARIDSLLLRLAMVIGAAFLLLYVVLFMIVKRADRLIRLQSDALLGHEHIERYNRELEIEIARRNQVERSLSEAREKAEVANRAKSQFLANMSHELRTPLNAIIGFADLMRTEIHGAVGDAKYRDYVTNIYESGEHLLEIVNDILDLSRIEAGRIELDESWFDLGELVSDCARLIAGRAEEFGVGFDTRQSERAVSLLADRRLVKQILLNLLSNAVKFTKKGGSVVLSADIRDDGRVALAVRDTGIGIAEEDLPVVMSPFGQTDGALDRSHDGTGLGLPLAIELAKLHDAEVAIDSEVGRGTAVEVIFPVERCGEGERRHPCAAACGAARAG